jgi:spermidine synthase
VPTAPAASQSFNVYPYHVYVPSFGDWGFVMASRRKIDTSALRLPGVPVKFLSDDLLRTLFIFPKDSLARGEILANRIDDQVLVKYYRKGWRRYGP